MRIIERSTYERNLETKELFDKIRPLLDDGYSYNKALKVIRNANSINTNHGWYKDVVEYGESQGYLREKCRSNRGKKK